MNKHKHLTKFLKKFDHFINSLIIKKSKKLNFYEKKISLAQFIDSRRVFLAIFTLIILTFAYLSIPNFYDKSKIQDLIQNQVFERYNVKFHFSSDIQYNVFPWPNYTFKNVKISNQEIKLGDIEKLRLNLHVNNFFLLENLKIKEILLKDSRFNIDKKNINFFLNLLNYNFVDISIKILDSYIFFKKK